MYGFFSRGYIDQQYYCFHSIPFCCCTQQQNAWFGRSRSVVSLVRFQDEFVSLFKYALRNLWCKWSLGPWDQSWQKQDKLMENLDLMMLYFSQDHPESSLLFNLLHSQKIIVRHKIYHLTKFVLKSLFHMHVSPCRVCLMSGLQPLAALSVILNTHVCIG